MGRRPPFWPTFWCTRAAHLLSPPLFFSSSAYTWAHWPDSVSTRIGLGSLILWGRLCQLPPRYRNRIRGNGARSSSVPRSSGTKPPARVLGSDSDSYGHAPRGIKVEPLLPKQWRAETKGEQGRKMKVVAAMEISRACVSSRGRKTWCIALTWG
jgi:hypothetical protein